MTRDLSKLASTSCGGLNLEEELKKYLLPSPPRTPPKAEGRKRKIALSGPEAQKRLKEGERERVIHSHLIQNYKVGENSIHYIMHLFSTWVTVLTRPSTVLLVSVSEYRNCLLF